MSKYIFLYRGPATQVEAMTEEQGAEQMKAWGDWMERVGPALVDAGSPLGARTSVADDGSTPPTSDQNGYSIVEADTLDGAKALVEKHPFLSEGKGRFAVEIFECLPM